MADQPSDDDAPAFAAKKADPTPHGEAITARAVTINKPVTEVYSRFRDFAAWPAFMENVVRITVHDERRSHWVVKAPGGGQVEWDARITEEVPGRSIAWVVSVSPVLMPSNRPSATISPAFAV